jgi:hypothetical protein
MSQFDFPRINFHGTSLLDTATANNGNYEPGLTMFDQESSMTYLPPRCYIAGYPNAQPPPGIPILTDKTGNQYVPIEPINADNYQAWAITPLGQFAADAEFLAFYTTLQINGKTPGYWNYYGDLSMVLQDVLVTGITVPDASTGTVTYTPQNSAGCPADLAAMLGAELSFNLNYNMPGSRTSAYLCDVDSMGQMCTQIFCGTAGLYSIIDGIATTFFTGSPGKSTARWMNLTRVVNYVYLVPMGGSASFYCTIQLDPGSLLAQAFEQYTGEPVTALFMKLLIHEVYEVRNPDYNLIPTKAVTGVKGNVSYVPKNPAVVSISGSITPWKTGDLLTAPLSRILKASNPININLSGIPQAQPLPVGSTPLGIWPAVQLGPVHFIINQQTNLLSLDFINAINEYGTNPDNYPSFAGSGDIPPFQDFVNYNYGDFELIFQPDSGAALNLATITYAGDYNMPQFLATGGMVDIVVPQVDYSGGMFYITLNTVEVLLEDQVYITTDQQGIYATQNQVPPNLYLSDGLPRIPFILRVLYRGNLVSSTNPVSITLQAINMVTYVSSQTNPAVYDQMPYVFPVDIDGCMTYIFAFSPNDLFPAQPSLPGIIAFAMRAYLAVVRVLSADLKLDAYLKNEMPVSWSVVYKYIFELYKTLYPVMDLILPMTEANWSDPTIQGSLLELTSEENWAKPMFMPVTRDMTPAQRALIHLWVKQSREARKQTL